MKRRNFGNTGSCSFDIYDTFPGRKSLYGPGGNFTGYETLKAWRERVKNILLDYVEEADGCNTNTHYNSESGSFIVTLADKQIKDLVPAVRAAGLKHMKTFINPKSKLEIRMYGYFRTE